MTLRRSIGFAWLMAAVLLMPAHSAMAKGGKGGGAAVVIDSVQFVDLPGGKKNIEILGGGLTPNSGLPVVTLDGVIELDVLEATTLSTGLLRLRPTKTPPAPSGSSFRSAVGRKRRVLSLVRDLPNK